jgi:hypothetical protein
MLEVQARCQRVKEGTERLSNYFNRKGKLPVVYIRALGFRLLFDTGSERTILRKKAVTQLVLHANVRP